VKPYSEACARNSAPILAVLRAYFDDRQRVLEIGSGTGQHAVHFAAAMPWLQWQTSDRAENLDGIRAWLDEAALPNTPPPLRLDVEDSAWQLPARYDAAYSANTLHIMSWPQVVQLFAHLPEALNPGAKLVLYGPFNYGGKPSSESNARFDASLRANMATRGIRDFEAVAELATAAGFSLLEDREMPANNRCLIWQYRSA
jgi:SAM-dependent methyltransferase